MFHLELFLYLFAKFKMCREQDIAISASFCAQICLKIKLAKQSKFDNV